MEISREEARVLVVPFCNFLETMTVREVYGGLSTRKQEENKMHRNFLIRLLSAQDRIILDDISAIKVGILEGIDKGILEEVVSGNYSTSILLK